MKVNTGVIALALFVMLASVAASPVNRNGEAAGPRATCFCQISSFDMNGKITPTDVFMDLTAQVGKTYGGPSQQSEYNQDNCRHLCKIRADMVGEQNVRAAACAAGVFTRPPTWLALIKAWSRVGTRPFRLARDFGSLFYKPELKKKVCTCPSGWLANTTNVDGGVTGDGRCKRLAAKPININPLPSDGTPVGSWGFTWGNELWAYGSTTNGGSAVCVDVILQEKECNP